MPDINDFSAHIKIPATHTNHFSAQVVADGQLLRLSLGESFDNKTVEHRGMYIMTLEAARALSTLLMDITSGGQKGCDNSLAAAGSKLN